VAELNHQAQTLQRSSCKESPVPLLNQSHVVSS
jgi:hypothetical protein